MLRVWHYCVANCWIISIDKKFLGKKIDGEIGNVIQRMDAPELPQLWRPGTAASAQAATTDTRSDGDLADR